jgi:hypothetical protein
VAVTTATWQHWNPRGKLDAQILLGCPLHRGDIFGVTFPASSALECAAVHCSALILVAKCVFCALQRTAVHPSALLAGKFYTKNIASVRLLIDCLLDLPLDIHSRMFVLDLAGDIDFEKPKTKGGLFIVLRKALEKKCCRWLVFSMKRNTNRDEIVRSIVYQGRYFPNTIFTKGGRTSVPHPSRGDIFGVKFSCQ